MLRCVTVGPVPARLFLCLALCLAGLLTARPVRAGISGPNLHFTVIPPTPIIHMTAQAAEGGACDWIKITLDGVEYDATVTDNGGSYTGSPDWDSSQAGNPSEHTTSARAQFTRTFGTYHMTTIYNSTDAADQGNDGYPADFIIADLRLKSFEYVNAYTLRNSASATPAPTPDPAVVPSPQFVWGLNGNATTSGEPAGDIQAKIPAFKIKLHPLTGGATVGFKLNWMAMPNTGDTTLTLYDNTTNAPTPMSAGAFDGNAQRALLSKVAKYSSSCTLGIWVKFTHLPTQNPTWKQAGSTYVLGHTLYATLAQPTAPMAEPWVGVLNYACDWAKGTDAATAATTAVCNGFYTNAKYSPSRVWYTDSSVPEKFRLLSFLNKTLGASTAPSGLQGQCNDFADFLTCLSTALGAVPLQSQKSNGGFDYSNVLFAPDTNGTRSGYFNYHQWTASGNVFDSAIRPSQSTVSPPVNEALSTYLDCLAPDYGLTAGSTFTPDVVN